MPKVSLDSQTIVAGFTANDLEKSIRFYTEGLGFDILEKHDREGILQYVMLKAGAGQLAIGRDDFAKGKDRLKGVGMRIYITTAQELAPLAAQAKAAGITLDSDIEKMPWGPLAFSLTDPDGFKLTISNPG